MGRKQLTISIPEAMHRYVEARVYERAFTTVSEYFRELVRHDEFRQLGRMSAEKRYGQNHDRSAVRQSLASAARRLR